MTLTGLLYDLLITFLILAAAAGAGQLLLAGIRIRSTTPLELYWLAIVCGLGMLSLSTLVLGMAGLLMRPLLLALLCGLAIIAIWSTLYQSRTLLAQAWQWLALPAADWLMRGLIWLLIGMGIGTAGYALLTYALMPPYEWDELAYHLNLPKLYLAAGRIYYTPDILHSNWPMNSNMLFVLALAAGSDVATHLLMLALTLLLAGGCIVFAVSTGDVRYGWIAAALLLLVPLIWRLAGTAMVDIAPALPALAAFLALLRWQEQRQWQWLMLSGLCAGFAAGGKVMVAGIAALIGVLLLLHELRQRPLAPLALLRVTILYSGAALLGAGGWYARSWWHTGNPIWPLLYPVLGGRDWDLLGHEYLTTVLLNATFALQFPHTLSGLLGSYTTLLLKPQPMDLFEVGYGILLPAGVVAAALLTPRSPRWLWQCLLLAGGWYLLWFLLVSHQLRFLLPGIAFAALPTSYLLVQIYDAARHIPASVGWLRWGTRVLLAGAILWLASSTLPWADGAARDVYTRREPYLRGQISRSDMIQSRLPTLPALDFINRNLSADTRILFVPYETRTYYLERDFLWGNLVGQRVLRFEQFANTPDLLPALQAQGITHMVYMPWEPFGLPYEEHYYALIEQLRNQCSTLLYSTPYQDEQIEVRQINAACIPP